MNPSETAALHGALALPAPLLQTIAAYVGCTVLNRLRWLEHEVERRHALGVPVRIHVAELRKFGRSLQSARAASFFLSFLYCELKQRPIVRRLVARGQHWDARNCPQCRSHWHAFDRTTTAPFACPHCGHGLTKPSVPVRTRAFRTMAARYRSELAPAAATMLPRLQASPSSRRLLARNAWTVVPLPN